MARPFGRALPELRTPVPGPESRRLADRLALVESRNITRVADDWPVFWAEARGANVRDADGNVYVDLTAGFSVAAAGHADRGVASAVSRQVRRLPHALGDVHPADAKVELLERLAGLAPAGLDVGILAGGGAEAVEAALKTAVMRTGRPGVVAFTGAYHGLTYGALAATWRRDFRQPFEAQLYGGVRFAPYPYPFRPPPEPGAAPGGETGRIAWGSAREPASSRRRVAGDSPQHGESDPRDLVRRSLEYVERAIAESEQGRHPVGAVIVEPIQGRGGLIVPPPGFLPGLRELCDGRNVLLILDEVYTGFGRTGRWFACEHEGVIPDILVVGKALGDGLPISATLGTREVMDAWPPSAGEAIHTSTFLGNPVACAAALAHLDAIERRGLVERAARLGEVVSRRLQRWRQRYPLVGDIRGRGLMLGAELVEPGPERRPATERQPVAALRPATDSAQRIVSAALRAGVFVLAEGPAGNVLAITPPLVITRPQLDHALHVIEEALEAGSGGA